MFPMRDWTAPATGASSQQILEATERYVDGRPTDIYEGFGLPRKWWKDLFENEQEAFRREMHERAAALVPPGFVIVEQSLVVGGVLYINCDWSVHYVLDNRQSGVLGSVGDFFNAENLALDLARKQFPGISNWEIESGLTDGRCDD